MKRMNKSGRGGILGYSFGFTKEKKVRSGRELLICTAAKGEKKECGRTLRLTNTAANEKDRVAAVRIAHLDGRK